MPRRSKSDPLSRDEILRERERLEKIHAAQMARNKAAYMARRRSSEQVALQIKYIKEQESSIWQDRIDQRIAKMRKAKQEHLALYGVLNLTESQCDHVDLD